MYSSTSRRYPYTLGQEFSVFQNSVVRPNKTVSDEVPKPLPEPEEKSEEKVAVEEPKVEEKKPVKRKRKQKNDGKDTNEKKRTQKSAKKDKPQDDAETPKDEVAAPHYEQIKNTKEQSGVQDSEIAKDESSEKDVGGVLEQHDTTESKHEEKHDGSEV